MSKLRFVITCAVAFIVAEVLEVVVHGVILDPDYEPFRGTLLRNMEGDAAAFALLPLAHLSFVIALVWVYSRIVRPGAWLRQGLILGLLAWFIGQVPLWMVWYAEQPWPGSLVVKQLGLELIAMLILGMIVAAIYRPAAAKQ